MAYWVSNGHVTDDVTDDVTSRDPERSKSWHQYA